MRRIALTLIALALTAPLARAEEPQAKHKPPLAVAVKLTIDAAANRCQVEITVTNTGKQPLRVIRPLASLAKFGGRLHGWTLALHGPAGEYRLKQLPAPRQMLQDKDIVLLQPGKSVSGTVDLSEARAAKGQVFGEDKGRHQVSVRFEATKSTYMGKADERCFLGSRDRWASAIVK